MHNNVNSSEYTRSTHCILATETNTNQMTISGVSKYVWLHRQWCTKVLIASYSYASNSFSFLQWHCKIGMDPYLWALTKVLPGGGSFIGFQIIWQQCCQDPIFSVMGSCCCWSGWPGFSVWQFFLLLQVSMGPSSIKCLEMLCMSASW